MSFTRYKQYKDSGVQWLGRIPCTWGVKRIRHLFEIRKRISGSEGYEVLSITQQGIKPKDIESGDGQLSSDYSKYQFVEIGDFAMNHMDLLTGYVDISSRFGVTSPDYRVFGIRNKELCFDRYYLYLLQAGYRNKIFFAFGQGSSQLGRWRFPTDEFNNFELPCPPIDEQRQIADFLDRETFKIDSLVAEQRTLIRLMKEKRQVVIAHAVTQGINSRVPTRAPGIEWLGKIPQHWEVVRLGALFKEVADPGDDELPLLSVSIHDGVSDREFDDEEMDRKVTRSEDRTKYKRVDPGDLVYNMMRAWQGGFGTVTVPGMVSPAYVVARPISDIRTEFVEQVLRTPQAVEELRRHSRGVTDFRLRLYWDEFKSIKIALPPIQEQDRILTSIGLETPKLDALMAEAEIGISLLQERRTALISAAVTGKIDVRGLAAVAPDKDAA